MEIGWRLQSAPGERRRQFMFQGAP